MNDTEKTCACGNYPYATVRNLGGVCAAPQCQEAADEAVKKGYQALHEMWRAWESALYMGGNPSWDEEPVEIRFLFREVVKDDPRGEYANMRLSVEISVDVDGTPSYNELLDGTA